MTIAKVHLNFRLPRRLVKVIEDIAPLFKDSGLNDPNYGAMTRALEYILQYYMVTDDYLKKVKFIKQQQWEIFLHLAQKEKEWRESQNK